MNHDDLDLAGTLAKAAADSALEPVKEAATNLVSPFTKEVGLLFALPFQWWRFKATLTIIEKAKRLLAERGTKPQQVPLKLLSSILEYGSLEDDEGMKDRWASLLSSTADPDYRHSIMPSFAHILNELSPKEVFILQAIYCFVPEDMADPTNKTLYLPSASQLRERVGLGLNEWNVACDNLHRLRLIDLVLTHPVVVEEPMQKLLLESLRRYNDDASRVTPNDRFNLTSLGLAFVRACCHGKITPPSPLPNAGQSP
jgi:hypothetical protein